MFCVLIKYFFSADLNLRANASSFVPSEGPYASSIGDLLYKAVYRISPVCPVIISCRQLYYNNHKFSVFRNSYKKVDLYY